MWRGGQPRALASPEKLLSPSLRNWAGGPQPAPGMEPKKMVAAASHLLGSRFQDGQLHTGRGLRLHSSQSYGGGQQKGKWLGGRPGGGAGREEREGEPSTCSVQRPRPNQGWPPPGSPRPGPQQPSRQTDVDVHTHSLTHSNHTRTRTPLLTFRPSVENTAWVNSVKRSAQQELGRMSFCREAGPLGSFPSPPPPLI